MELYQLEYFLELARQGNFTRAAERLHLAQPALSQQIRSLEAELGVSLFVRDRRRTRLTGAGEALKQKAEALLQLAQETRQAVADIASLKRGRLAVAAIPSLSGCWLPQVIETFRDRHPGIELVLLEEGSERVAEYVAAGTAELGLLQFPTDPKRFVATPLFREPFVLLAHRRHFPGKSSVKLGDLREQSFIFYKGRARDVAMEACRQAGFEPKVACESSELETIRALVNARLGLALLPQLAVSKPLPATLRVIPLAHPKVERQLGWIYRRREPLSAAAQMFVDAFPA